MTISSRMHCSGTNLPRQKTSVTCQYSDKYKRKKNNLFLTGKNGAPCRSPFFISLWWVDPGQWLCSHLLALPPATEGRKNYTKKVIQWHSLTASLKDTDAQSAFTQWLPPSKHPLLRFCCWTWFLHSFGQSGCVLLMSPSSSSPTSSLTGMDDRVGNRESSEAVKTLFCNKQKS